MKEINFMTIGDKNYFPFINFSIKKVMKFYPSSKLFIYDWGFTNSQKKRIKSYPITELIDWTEKVDRISGYKTIRKIYEGYNPPEDYRRKEYLLNQKPICLLDCAKKIEENLTFFDGDAILINPINEIFEDDFDIGVTISSKKAKLIAEKKFPNSQVIFSNSNPSREKVLFDINSGVLFFKLDSQLMQLFIQEWINEIKTCKRWLMEQSSLILMLKKRKDSLLNKSYNMETIKISNSEFKIKTFPMEIYNLVDNINQGYNDKKVKILHFLILNKYFLSRKGVTLYVRKIIREIKIHRNFFRFFKLFPSTMKIYIKELFALNLLLRLIINPINISLIKMFLLKILFNLTKSKKILSKYPYLELLQLNNYSL